jgi:6-phosphofructokinase 1
MKKEMTVSKICATLDRGIRRGKNSSIIVKAEGAGDSTKLAAIIEKKTGMETRNTVLGYIQRGGSPTAFSRRLALTYGFEAVMALKKMGKGQSRMVGFQRGEIAHHDMKKVIGKERTIDYSAFRMNEVFSI